MLIQYTAVNNVNTVKYSTVYLDRARYSVVQYVFDTVQC